MDGFAAYTRSAVGTSDQGGRRRSAPIQHVMCARGGLLVRLGRATHLRAIGLRHRHVCVRRDERSGSARGSVARA
eukprot:267104-Prymnesium_polylepis.5